jgi:hypothetical protein
LRRGAVTQEEAPMLGLMVGRHGTRVLVAVAVAVAVVVGVGVVLLIAL